MQMAQSCLVKIQKDKSLNEKINFFEGKFAMICRYAKAAPVLLERSRRDFWCGLLVVNSYALYCTWTFLASLLNLSIFLIHEVLHSIAKHL
jgi:hypothetical protein